MILDNILQAMGNTPLIRLRNIPDEDSADVLVKFEGLNVGGSIKTRSALAMIEKAEQEGKLHRDSIIVEPTSGNQGIGLALVGAIKGYQVRIIMPDSVSEERRKMIAHYGAQLVLVHDKGNIGKAVEECLNLAKKMKQEDNRVFVPQQFENSANVLAQYNTGLELLKQAQIRIDGFCAGIGTGGSISGIGIALKEANQNTIIWAVEPENAAILSGGTIGEHIQMGIGDGLIPANLNQRIYDDVCIVTDEQALMLAKRLAKEEGIACGISSGSNLVAALKLAKQLGKGKTVVTVLADTAERYYSTELFDEI